MKPMYISINSEKTGANLKSLFKNNGYSVRDIQSVMDLRIHNPFINGYLVDHYLVWIT